MTDISFSPKQLATLVSLFTESRVSFQKMIKPLATKKELQKVKKDLTEDIIGMKNVIAGIEGNITGMKSSIAGMKDDVVGMKSNIAGMQGDIVGMQGDIAGMKSNTTGMQSDIAGMKSNITGMQGDIAGMKGDVAGIKKDMKLLAKEKDVLQLIEAVGDMHDDLREDHTQLERRVRRCEKAHGFV